MIDLSYVNFMKLNSLKGSRQLAKTIGKKVVNIEKFNSNILGNIYKDNQKSPKLRIRK